MNLYEVSLPGQTGSTVISQRFPGDSNPNVKKDGIIGYFTDSRYPFRMNFDENTGPKKGHLTCDIYLAMSAERDNYQTDTYPNDPVPRGKRESLAFLEWFRDTHPEYKDMIIKYVGPPDAVAGDERSNDNEDYDVDEADNEDETVAE